MSKKKRNDQVHYIKDIVVPNGHLEGYVTFCGERAMVEDNSYNAISLSKRIQHVTCKDCEDAAGMHLLKKLADKEANRNSRDTIKFSGDGITTSLSDFTVTRPTFFSTIEELDTVEEAIRSTPISFKFEL